MQEDSVTPGDNVIVVDDVIATGNLHQNRESSYVLNCDFQVVQPKQRGSL